MSILVTGTSGFAGSHLIDYLRTIGDSVEAFRGDLRSLDDCRKQMQGVDTLYHLAAVTMIDESREKPFETWESNTTGTLNLLTAAKENNVAKVVYASTCHIYGKQPREAYPLTEETFPRPCDIYSASKYAGEHICQSFVQTHNMNISITRAFNHYGPRQRPEFVIPGIILQAVRLDKVIHLRNPSPTRDFTYVDDIIEGYEDVALFGEPGEVYQLCSGVEHSIMEVAETVIKVAGLDSTIAPDMPYRPADLNRSVGSYAKAQQEFGWKPKVSFEDGLKKTIDWMRARLV